nr:DUF2787 domain-containing protein [Vibrio parahaemolyticus]
MNISNAYLLSLEPINKFIALTLDQYAIPSNAKRLALNFKCSQFYIDKRGIQPVEIQIERTDENAGWEIRFVATFDYPTLNSESLDVSLYFNFISGGSTSQTSNAVSLTGQKLPACSTVG